MKVKLMKSNKEEHVILNVEALIYDLPEKALKIYYRKDMGIIYLGKIETIDFSLDDVFAFVVENEQ